MNDLPNSVEIANITMFADDTSLFRSFKSIGELELLPAWDCYQHSLIFANG